MRVNILIYITQIIKYFIYKSSENFMKNIIMTAFINKIIDKDTERDNYDIYIRIVSNDFVHY